MIKKHSIILETISYLDIFLFQIAYIFFASLLISFYPENLISFSDQKYNTNSFLDYVYFVIVTYTSLGYGEIIPVKLGRYISILTIIIGFTSLSILISKISSEKSSYTTRFLLTSDQQRRLREFKKNIINYIEILSNQDNKSKLTKHPIIAIRENRKHKQIKFNSNLNNEQINTKLSVDLFSLEKYLLSIYSYIKFNSQNTDLTIFGNKDELIDLLKKIGILCKKIEASNYSKKGKKNILEKYSQIIAFLINAERNAFKSPSTKVADYFINYFSKISNEIKSKKFKRFKKQSLIVIKSKNLKTIFNFFRKNNFYSFKDFYYVSENEFEKELLNIYENNFNKSYLFPHLYKNLIKNFLKKHLNKKIKNIPNEIEKIINNKIHANDKQRFRFFFYTELDNMDITFLKYGVREI